MSEQIIVYAFLDSNKDAQEFVTLDPVVAARYAEDNDFDIVERVYEYSRTLSAAESQINQVLDL